MKKNIFNRLKAAVIAAGLIIAGLTSTGCKNGLIQNPEDKIAYITPVVNTDTARTVFPNADVSELKTIALSYTDTTEKTYAIWDTYKEFTDAKIALESGVNYVLTLSGYIGGAKFKASTKVTPVAGENTVTFDMAVVSIGEDSGSIELIATFPKATAVKSNSVRLFNVADGEVKDIYQDKNNIQSEYMKDGTQYITFAKNSIPAGIYKFEITVTDTADKTGYVSDYIYVYEGCASAKSYELKFADIYSLASGVYSDTSKHALVEPDTETNKGVKVTLKAVAGEGAWTGANIVSSRTQVGMYVDKQNCPKVGSDSPDFYFPFGTDGELDIFTIQIWQDADNDGNADTYFEEKVISDSNGANTDLFNKTDTNLYNKAELTLSTTGANLKLSKDIRTFLVQDKINRDYFDEVTVTFYVRSGHTDWSDGTEDAYSAWDYSNEWREHASWSGSFTNENYEKLISKTGFDVHNAASLEKLSKHDNWWATVGLWFRLKDGDNSFFTTEISSEETLYTPVKLNKYDFKFTTKDIFDFSNSYEDGTKVTLPEYVHSDYKLVGWYDNKDFTGNPIKEITASKNNGSKTFYGKVARVFNMNKWEENGTTTHNYMLCADYSLANSKITSFDKGDKVRITLSGVPNISLENKYFVIDFGHWDMTKKDWSEDTMHPCWSVENGKYPERGQSYSFSFEKGESTEMEFEFTATEYTVNKDTCIWFFLGKDQYDEEPLLAFEDFKLKVEIVE